MPTFRDKRLHPIVLDDTLGEVVSDFGSHPIPDSVSGSHAISTYSRLCVNLDAQAGSDVVVFDAAKGATDQKLEALIREVAQTHGLFPIGGKYRWLIIRSP